jgi:hypothetical protein
MARSSSASPPWSLSFANWLDRKAVRDALDDVVWQTTPDIAAKAGIPEADAEQVLEEMRRLGKVDVTWDQNYMPVCIRR